MDNEKYTKAIKLLRQKIERLEKQKEYIKTKYYYESEIAEINSAIKEIKRKIKILEKIQGVNTLADKRSYRSNFCERRLERCLS